MEVIRDEWDRFLLTRHCPSGQVRAPALWSKAGCTLREVDALQREVRSRRAPQAVDGGGFQGERGPEAWISLFSVGGHGPAGACVDFEPLPHRTEPKPREAWPPPGRPPLGCDSRNWALSVGPRFRGWVSCHFPSVMWPLARTKWVGRRLAVRQSSRQGSGDVRQRGEWLECRMWESWEETPPYKQPGLVSQVRELKRASLRSPTLSSLP